MSDRLSSVLIAVALGVMLGVMPGRSSALECRDMRFDEAGFTVCTAHPASEEMRLFLTAPGTQAPFGSFANVERHLKGLGKSLRFAMNAGMYHSDRRPVGLYVEDGAQRAPLITSDGPGNFGLLPNGVFCVGAARADVIETRRFARLKPSCRHATQSGPMLVIDGALHPRFLEDSDSLYIRNGVGTSADGNTVHFVISRDRVNFHTFGRFFRDALKVPQALYFDGNISRLHAPGIGRSDGGFPMGPIIGIVGGGE